MNKNKKQQKTLNEELSISILIMFIILVLYFSGFVIFTISHDENLWLILKDWSSFHPSVALMMLLILYIIVIAIRYGIYTTRKRMIITNGDIQDGEIVGTRDVTEKFSRGPGPVYNYRYKVKLSDGRIIETEAYGNDFVNNQFIKKCTVYEYRNKYYFTNFQ